LQPLQDLVGSQLKVLHGESFHALRCNNESLRRGNWVFPVSAYIVFLSDAVVKSSLDVHLQPSQ